MMCKIEVSQEEFNRWAWHCLIFILHEQHNFIGTVEDSEEYYIAVMKGLTNKQLKKYFDIDGHKATLIRRDIKENRLDRVYNKIFKKNNMLFSEYGVLGRINRGGRNNGR